MRGQVTIERVPGLSVPLLGDIYRSWVPPSPLSWVLGDIVLTNLTFDYGHDFAVYSVIHEFGHAWDVRTGLQLSAGMLTQFWVRRCTTGGGHHAVCYWILDYNKEHPPGAPQNPYAGRNQLEDWAESFANYVDPYYSGKYDKYGNPFWDLGPLRRQYVEDQIDALP
jgi:hypothetical protein